MKEQKKTIRVDVINLHPAMHAFTDSFIVLNPGLNYTVSELHHGIMYSVKTTRWKTRGRGPGVRGPGVRGPGVWKTRGLVENAESGGKRGIRWKTRGPGENAGSGEKRGVWWKTRGLVENAGSGGKRGV